jgi:hypothetical protein
MHVKSPRTDKLPVMDVQPAIVIVLPPVCVIILSPNEYPPLPLLNTGILVAVPPPPSTLTSVVPHTLESITSDLIIPPAALIRTVLDVPEPRAPILRSPPMCASPDKVIVPDVD